MSIRRKRYSGFHKLLIAVWVALASFQAVNAQVVDESTPFVAPLPSVGEDGNYDYFAQSFVAEVTRVSKVGVWLRADSAGGEVELTIFGNSAGNTPDLNYVVYQSALVTPTTQGGWVYDTIASAAMIPGNIYWLAIDGYSNIIATGFSSAGISTTPTSTNSPMYGSQDGGQTWQLAINNPMAIYVEGDTCSVNVSIDLNEPVICPGDTLDLEATFGYASYVWSNGSTNNTISITSGGFYSVTVSNAQFCLGTATVSVGQAANPDPGLQPMYNKCVDTDLRLTVFPFFTQYIWSSGSTTSVEEISAPGTYTLQVVDQNQCAATDTFEVVEVPSPVVDLGSDTTLCSGQFYILDAGPSLASYLWSSGEGSRSISVFVSGDYWVRVTNQAGCVTISDTISVIFQPAPDTPTISFNLQGIISSFGFSYQWFRDGNALPATGQQIMDPVPGDYQVIVTNGFGCSTMSEVFSIEEISIGSFISEGFSPNGDGLNEVFFVEGIEIYPNSQLTILNRWGEVVLQETGYRNNWRGTGPGGKPLPDGNYYYVLELGGGLPTRKGAVVINR